MTKIAVVVSHPIQHFCPQYSSWSQLPGVELHVLFASKSGILPYRDTNFGVTVEWDGLRLDFSHEFLPGAEVRKVERALDSEHVEARLDAFCPDAVVFYGYAQRLQRRAVRWAVKRGVPRVMIADSELRSHRSVFKRMVKSALLPAYMARVSRFLTVGDANEAYLRQYGVRDDKFIRSFFPIDIAAFDTLLAEREVVRNRRRMELGIPEHHTIILQVGKLVPWKRPGDLVQLSNRLLSQRDDITVVLVGSGLDEERLRRGAKRIGPGGVIFTGFVRPKELMEYYLAADIYAHCAEREPHSLAVSEAVYSGLPVVLSDRCGSFGPTDDVQSGRNGLVYRCGDLIALRRAVLRLVEAPQLRSVMSNESATIGKEHQKLAHGQGLERAIQSLDAESASEHAATL